MFPVGEDLYVIVVMPIF